MAQDDDKTPEPTTESLHDQALRLYGQRFFAEAKNQSARDDAELEAWKKGQRGQRGWLSRLGGLGAPDSESGGDSGK